MQIEREGTKYIRINTGRALVPVVALSAIVLLQFYTPVFSQNPAPSDTSQTTGLRFPINERNNFPFSNSGNQSPLLLQPPSNIEQKIEYDPETGRYIFSERVGELDYRPPASMSLEEYKKYDAHKSELDYWREKSREESGAGPSFMKNLRLGNEAIDKVFGTDVINITPQGSAELVFGYTISRNDNPLLPEKNRRNGSFLFEEKIQMNVTGSIGDKMEVGLSYNTEASFDFENKTKLEYSGKEDEIIKKIEAGDVSFSLPGSLITGSQSLFGLKTELQFGRLTVTSVVSHQLGESSSINVQGGAQLTEFEVNADEYDANRHFFLAHFFRDHYNDWLQNLPYIESQVQIQQIEVWIVNKQSDYSEVRNIVAFMDLGEGYDPDHNPNFYADESIIGPIRGNDGSAASNNSNGLYDRLYSEDAIRALGSAENLITSVSNRNFNAGRDYVLLESARPLSDREYTLNKELGYISLNSPLRNDEILAVAFTYTYRGRTYQVGELTNQVVAPGVLILKLLKGTTPSPKFPNWDLMMKNVYSIGAYQVSPENFVLNLLYRNDKTGVPVNYISETDSTAISPLVQKQPLLKVLELDNLDSRNEPNPDGIFDYVEGVTINSKNGRIYFPLLEPFGSDLRQKIVDSSANPIAAGRIASKYIFEELYDSTQTRAEQIAEKNKFFLKGQYQSSSSSEIQLNAMNIPKESVVVTAGGRSLVENVDYTVDYTLGRVKIINQGLLESGTPISISLESNSLFNLQTKTLLGTHLDYRFSENFNVGATLMNLTETPYNDKVNMGDEPISNTIWGLNTSYRTQSQLLTSLVDKLPFLETKQTSSIMFEAEFAHLIPGQANVIGKNGEASIDDFEAAQTKIEMKNFSSWRLASSPKNNPDFWNSDETGLDIGYGRAKLAWYVIDPLFYRNGGLNPGNPEIEEDLNSHYARRIREKEIFPTKESDLPGENFISILNLAYYPEERGPYNYDPDLTPEIKLDNPDQRWAGIMREIINSDFETSNIEFIEFWLMDPFLEDPNHTGGDLYIHLGEISEDILPDSRKAYEGGLPSGPDDTTGYDVTIWGHVPSGQAYMNTFTGEESRVYQDIGLDGLNNDDEVEFFSDYIQSIDENISDAVSTDISADDFEYFLSDEHDLNGHGILERYKNYNNLEGNSPPELTGLNYTPSNSNEPDIEDINNDNTLNTVETYFQYHISLRPNDLEQVGRNFIVDQIEDEVLDFDSLVRWYQFRIPLSEWESKIGDIEDFKSVRFMRVMLSGFEQEVILRFATFDMLRGEWRRYNFDISETNPDATLQPGGTTFEVSAVNIEENSERIPVKYVLPPGVDRLIDPGNPQVAHLNEQSISLKIGNLEDADARAVFKNVQLDLRQYKKIQMFTHAEALPEQEGSLGDYEISAFIRIGSDYKNNYYEFEIPLKVTPHGSEQNDVVWPDLNEMELIMGDFVELKKERNEQVMNDPLNYSVQSVYTKLVPAYENGELVKYNIMKVKGNPNLGNIRQIMLGVRNPGDATSFERINDGLAKSAEIWFNELRVSDFDNRGGWAANGQVQAQLADFGVVSVAGSTSTPGFGSIEEKVEERSMEQVNQYDISTNLELGKFFPEKANVSIPLYFGTSKTIVNPEYFPKDPDIKFADILAEAENKAERDSLKQISQDLTSRASVNVTNMRWNKRFNKVNIFSPANLSASIGYTQTLAHNYSTEYNNLWKYNANVNYVFNTRPKNIQPFKKSKALKKPTYQIIRDFNFNPYPSRITLGTQLDRNYQEMKMRNVFEDIELLIEPTVNKDFTWNRKFEMMWDLTRALKLNYSATTAARIDEPQGQQDLFISDNELWKNEVWSSIMEGGRNMNYLQKSDISYTVPINKIPVFNWVSLNTSYGTTYNWLRGEVVPGRTLGNTIKNSNSIKVSSNLNLKSLYSKLNYLKNLDAKYSKSKSGKTKTPENIRYKEVRYEKRTFFKKDEPKNIVHKLNTEEVDITVINAEGTEVEVKTAVVDKNKVVITASSDLTGVTVVIIGKIPRGVNPIVFLAENGIRLLTGFKSINLSWMQSSGSVLPGFLPETNLFGMNLSDFYGAPGWPFVFGLQDTGLVRSSINNNWLTRESTFSKPFEFNKTEDLSLRATFEPFKGLRIDLTANRSYSENNEQLFFYGDAELANYRGYYVDHIYTGGSFSISVITLASAFEHPSEDNNWNSPSFDRLSNNRTVISARRYRDRINSSEEYYYNLYHGDAEEYFDGYGPTSQEVLVPAFLSAYTGIDPENVTLESFFWTMIPNWKISFDGLSELEFIKKFLKTITLTHSYKSTYSVTGFGTNVSYFDSYESDVFGDESDIRSVMRDNQLDYIAQYQYNSVSINEQLNPLIGFDMTWHNSLLTKFEISNKRMVLLSLNNNQVNESRNNDYTIGAGYRFKEVPLNITAGGTKRQITSDLNVRFDISLRNNVTIIRFLTEQLDEENDFRVTTGARRVTMGITADYVFSKNFNVQFFFDREVNTPFTTTTFPTAETNIGLSLRLSL